MNTNKITIGLDLGDRKNTYCILSASGKILAGILFFERELLAGTRATGCEFQFVAAKPMAYSEQRNTA